jgi:hypothetical protein
MPYLSALQRQLGQALTAIVRKEIERYETVRENLNMKLEEAGGKREEAIRKVLEKMPRGLRHTRAFVAGPRSLPRGEATPLPLVARSSSGDHYSVGQYIVHADPGGNWSLSGYDSHGGRPRPIESIGHYEPDDLGAAIGTIDNFLGRLDSAASQYLEQAPVPGGALFGDGPSEMMPLGGGRSAPKQNEDPWGQQNKKSQTKGASSSTRLKKNMRRLLGGKETSGKAKIKNDPERKLSQKEVKRRLRNKKYRRAAPAWYGKLKSKRLTEKSRWKTFLRIATHVYNAAKEREATISQFWKKTEELCASKGLFQERYCWETGQNISTQNGKCTLSDQCSHFSSDGGGCTHQSFR